MNGAFKAIHAGDIIMRDRDGIGSMLPDADNLAVAAETFTLPAR